MDAYGWLHKAAYSCSYELCEGIHTDRSVIVLCLESLFCMPNSLPSDDRLVPCRFVSYCMGRVEVMRAAGVTPVIVFDGGRLPMKAGEEESRGRSV